MASNETPFKQGIIQKLDTTVINRIAAGEVIQRPCNAIKELVENSLDAGSTHVQITVASGGLKSILIQDNGSGVQKEDLPIVCERFTTSKLRQFEDLQSISTFGFRGEALASISHVAHVTITTRTKEENCAFKASYIDGKPTGSIRPCAGNFGTQILIDDLFYNVPIRKKALRSPAEEYAKIVDVASKYAIHFSGVGFTVKKQGESTADVLTSSSASIEDNVRTIYGHSVAKELVAVQVDDSKLKFRMSGFVSNANFSTKKAIFLLFVNNRLVDSQPLRKALEQLYSAYLPKGAYPFIYLSLTVNPGNLDVNVHPTKHEVMLLHEEQIVEKIKDAINAKLLGSNTSRTFTTQTLLVPSGATNGTTQESRSNAQSTAGVTLYPHQTVRTDSRLQKLDAFMTRNQPEASSTAASSSAGSRKRKGDHDTTTGTATREEETSNQPETREIKLTSVLTLRSRVEEACNAGLKDLFLNHQFVGIVDEEYALIQFGTQLILTNTTKISKELFYQKFLFGFGSFGRIKLSSPAPIRDCVLLAFELEESGWTPELGDKGELADFAQQLMVDRAEMLKDYFSMDVDKDGNLHSLPLLINNYAPDMDRLPLFLLRLSSEVNWENELECFETFGREMSVFYASQKPLFAPEMEKEKDQTSWKWTVEHVLYKELRTSLIPPQTLLDNKAVVQVAALEELYKVFERC